MLSQDEIELLNALLTPFEEVRQTQGKRHLGGMCVTVSFVAARILTNHNFRATTWHFQRGRYGDNLTASETYSDGHCWIASADGKTILDLTADQFGGERIYFGPYTAKYLTVHDDFPEPGENGFYAPVNEAFAARLVHQQNRSKK